MSSPHDDLGIDIPHLRLTPGGWLATGLDSPRIGVVGPEKAVTLELFRAERGKWRELIAKSQRGDEPAGLGWPA
jgi:hypothetical protein